MTASAVCPAGSAIARIGGRDGRSPPWWQRLRGISYDDEVVIPFDHVRAPKSDALRVVSELRGRYPDKTPLLFGSPHDTGLLLEFAEIEPRTVSEVERTAARFDLPEWLLASEQEAREFAEGNWPPRGPWPPVIAQQKFDGMNDIRHPNESVVIGLLPTRDSTLAAAYLNFGGWNACPLPEVHIALARRWQAEHGARLVTNSHDTLEFEVARPIVDREQALAVARVHYLYCSDTIDQGYDTLDRLAASLIGATAWTFWWD